MGLRDKKVKKMVVGDLKKMLADVPDDREIVLGFYMKDKPTHFVYLAEVLTSIGYDSVLKEKLFENKVVELSGFDHEFCKYIEGKNNE